VPVYEAFIRGAKDGWDIAVRIVPYLVAILTAVGMFTASGAMAMMVRVLDPITGPLGLPGAALPMALIRPLSGSGATGVLVSTMQDPATGPDTYTGFLVSTISGSTETTFYVLAVYFGSVGIRRFRHALPAALAADFAGIVGSVVAVKLLFTFSPPL
jgi:spore maturation protein SpmB